MRNRVMWLGVLSVVLVAPVFVPRGLAVAQTPGGAAPAAQAAATATRPIHVYLRAGLKTHGEGQHDYPQFLADWSKLLTDRGAVVDGSLHFPTEAELQGVDVIVMYKGDAGYMTATEKQTLENFLRRGGGVVGFHDTICADDPAWFSTIFGGAKKHGEVNYTLEAPVAYTFKEPAHPITAGATSFTIADEAFFSMTWATAPGINVLATAPMAPTQSAGTHGGEVVPQMWTYERTLFSGLGAQPTYRAFVWMQGHAYANLQHPQMLPILLRGVAWAAKAPVDSLLNPRSSGRGRAGGSGQGRQGGQGR